MVAGCGNKCVKYTFVFFNFILFVFGTLILALTLRIGLENEFQRGLTNILTDEEALVAVQLFWILMLLIPGGLFCLVGFLGCCGAICENKILLYVYFVIVLILAAIDLGLGAVIFALYKGFNNEYRSRFAKTLDEDSETPERRTNLELIENAFECCGTLKYPSGSGSCTPIQTAEGDCVSKIWNDIETGCQIMVIIALVVLAIELFFLIFSYVLCRAFRERSTGYSPVTLHKA